MSQQTKVARIVANLAHGFDPSAIEDALLESRLPMSQKVVAIAVLRHWSRKSPRPTAGTRRLAKLASCRIETVQGAIRALVNAGIIGVEGGSLRQRQARCYDLSPMPSALRALLLADPPTGSDTEATPDRRNGSDAVVALIPGSDQRAEASDPVEAGDLIRSGAGSDPLEGSKGSLLKKAPKEGCGGTSTVSVDLGADKEDEPDPWGLSGTGSGDGKTIRRQATAKTRNRRAPDLPSQIPEDWQPSKESVEAVAELVRATPGRIMACVAEFRIYWSERGSRKGKRGWDQAFRNRVVALAERGQIDLGPDPARPKPGPRPEPPPVRREPPPPPLAPPPRRPPMPEPSGEEREAAKAKLKALLPFGKAKPSADALPPRSRRELLAGLAALDAEPDDDEPAQDAVGGAL